MGSSLADNVFVCIFLAILSYVTLLVLVTSGKTTMEKCIDNGNIVVGRTTYRCKVVPVLNK